MIHLPDVHNAALTLVLHMGERMMSVHLSTKRHKDIAKSATTSNSVASFFRSDIPDSTSKAEVMWSMVVAKHNLTFLNNDYTNRMFQTLPLLKYLLVVTLKLLPL